MKEAVAIIGGGPAGLSAARALKTLGIPFTIFEKHSALGGIWDIDNPGSPMYRTAHFISSKTQSGHEGFPMPEHYPDYPSNRQIRDYIRSFASAFGLEENIVFNTDVTRLSQHEEGWQVDYTHEGKEHSDIYRWAVVASGTNWHPNRPEVPDEAAFTGEILHSVDYRDPDSLKGQRVLVVGAGNSGVDIACDAAFAAQKAYTSMRRGYHFVPKHIFGMPADVFGRQSKWMPMWLSQRIFCALLRLLNGDLTRLGLQKPDHRIFESHPIMNTQVLHYLQHGDLIAKPGIAGLSGNEVRFTDGTTIEVDKIILATGYDWKIPYVDQELFNWKDERPQTFLKTFNPVHPTLFINGFVETNSGAYKLFDETALLIAKAIEAQSKGHDDALKVYINGPEPDLGGKVKYIPTARHTGYTNVDAFGAAVKDMRRAMGWPAPQEFYGAP